MPILTTALIPVTGKPDISYNGARRRLPSMGCETSPLSKVGQSLLLDFRQANIAIAVTDFCSKWIPRERYDFSMVYPRRPFKPRVVHGNRMAGRVLREATVKTLCLVAIVLIYFAIGGSSSVTADHGFWAFEPPQKASIPCPEQNRPSPNAHRCFSAGTIGITRSHVFRRRGSFDVHPPGVFRSRRRSPCPARRRIVFGRRGTGCL